MAFRNVKNGLVLGVSLLASSFGHAQTAQLPIVGGLLGSLDGLPVVGALPLDALLDPIAGLAGGGLPGLDGLTSPLASLEDLVASDLRLGELAGSGVLTLPVVLLGDIASGGLPGLNELPLAGTLGLDGNGGGNAPGLSDLLDALPLLSSGTPQLPGVDALLSVLNGLGTGGLPGVDFLPLAPLAQLGMGERSIPGLDALIDIPALADYATLGKVEMAVSALENFITGIAADPQSLTRIGSELGPDTLLTAVPLLGVIVNEPASLPGYFGDGGTIINPQIELAPPIPVVSQPLTL